MSGPSKEDLQAGRVRAAATDLQTGKVEELTIRPGSPCHFFVPFICGRYRVCLRLDWADPDDRDRPMLDADFYDAQTGLMDKSMKRHQAHHTPSAQGEGRKYVWKFEDEQRRVQVALTWMAMAHAMGRAVASAAAVVIRAGQRE